MLNIWFAVESKASKEDHLGYQKKQQFQGNVVKKMNTFVTLANYPALTRHKQIIEWRSTLSKINKIQYRRYVLTTIYSFIQIS